MKNAYEILNVAQHADDETIKKALRALQLVYHPDKNSSPEASEQWGKISEAYELIETIEKRQAYNTALAEATFLSYSSSSTSSPSSSTLNSPRRVEAKPLVSPTDPNFEKDPLNYLPKFALLVKTSDKKFTKESTLKVALVSQNNDLMTAVFRLLANWEYLPTSLGANFKDFLDPNSGINFQFWGFHAQQNFKLTLDKFKGFSIVFLYGDDRFMQTRLHEFIPSVDPRNILLCELHYLAANAPSEQIFITAKKSFNVKLEVADEVLQAESELTSADVRQLNAMVILGKLTEEWNKRTYYPPVQTPASSFSLMSWFKRSNTTPLAIEPKHTRGVLILNFDETIATTRTGERYALFAGVRNMIKTAQDHNILVLILSESTFNSNKKLALDYAFTNHLFHNDQDVYDANRIKTLFPNNEMTKCTIISEIIKQRKLSSTLPILFLDRNVGHFVDAHKYGIKTLHVPTQGSLPCTLDENFFSVTVIKTFEAIFPEQSSSCTIC